MITGRRFPSGTQPRGCSPDQGVSRGTGEIQRKDERDERENQGSLDESGKVGTVVVTRGWGRPTSRWAALKAVTTSYSRFCQTNRVVETSAGVRWECSYTVT